jgi:hypothetical protein
VLHVYLCQSAILEVVGRVGQFKRTRGLPFRGTRFAAPFGTFYQNSPKDFEIRGNLLVAQTLNVLHERDYIFSFSILQIVHSVFCKSPIQCFAKEPFSTQ